MEQFRDLYTTFGIICEQAETPALDVRKWVHNQQDIMREELYKEEQCDVVFLCADRRQVYALSVLVCAGCEVLKLMLEEKMAVGGRKTYPLYLPDIHSTAMRVILEFLYFGSFSLSEESWSGKQWEDGLLTLEAAQRLKLENLERLVWEFLLSDTCQCLSYASQADFFLDSVNRLSAITNYLSNSMIDEAATTTKRLTVISTVLLSVVKKRWLTEDELYSMSTAAMLFWLQDVRRDVVDSGKLRLDVYLRFRQVIIWCVCRSRDHAELEVNAQLPSGREVLRFLQGHYTGAAPQLTNGRKGNLQSDVEILRQACVTEKFEGTFLHLLDIDLMHPLLLLKFIAPLKIISDLDLLPIFRDHTLNRVYISKSSKVTWEADACFRSCEDGSAISKVDYHDGWARALTPVSGFYGTFVWDIVFEHSCSEAEIREHELALGTSWEEAWILGIGKVCDDVGLSSWARDWECLWYLRTTAEGKLKTTVFCCGYSGSDAKTTTSYGSHVHSDRKSCFRSPRVKFRVFLDMERRTCSFSLNGAQLGIAWEDLPEGTYYPFISFHSRYKSQPASKKQKLTNSVGTEEPKIGTARIKLVSGFSEKWI